MPADKKDLEANESTALLAGSSAIAPPPYSIEADAPLASSSTTVMYASVPPPPAAPYTSLYPSIPPAPTASPHPTGPTPLRVLPLPACHPRHSFRAADRRARWRVFWALLWAFCIWILVANLLRAPELEGVRREGRREVRKAWRWIKGEWKKGCEWEREHHVVERVGKVIHPGAQAPGEPLVTILEASSTAAATSLAALD